MKKRICIFLAVALLLAALAPMATAEDCAHRNKFLKTMYNFVYTLEGTSNPQSAHRVIREAWQYWYCPDCGMMFSGKPNDAESGSFEGEHHFVDGVCSECGYVKPEPTATPTPEPTATPTPTPEPTATPTPAPVQRVIKLKASNTIKANVGDTVKIVVNAKVKSYQSSNPAVAKVSKKGIVTTKYGGTAKITVTLKSGKKLTFVVKVVDPKAPKKIAITRGKKAKIKAGRKLTLKTSLKPAGSRTALTWTSSNKKVATVSKKGVVKALKRGVAVITVTTANGKKAKIKITVK